MIRIILRLLIVLVFFIQSIDNLFCQNNIIQPLKIGDYIPAETKLTLTNSTNGFIKLSDLKGKLIIFDFWNVWCRSCIAAMPHMEELQNKFGDKIVVFLVTPDPQWKVDMYKQKSKNLRNTKLPMIINDSLLTKYFVYPSVPTHVYIDPAGKVLSITNDAYTSEENIAKILRGESVYMPEKKMLDKFNSSESFLTEGKGRHIKNINSYSLFTNYISGAGQGGASEIDSATGKLVWMHFVAITGITGYKNVFLSRYKAETNYIHDNRFIIDRNRITDFMGPNEDVNAWQEKYLFGYEVRLKENSTQDIYDLMREDLDRYFEIKSSCEKRTTKCLILKKIDNKPLPLSKKVNQVCLEKEDGYALVIENFPLSQLAGSLSIRNPLPVLDESGFTKNVDIKIKSKLNDIESVRKELKSYGLDLITEDRDMMMIVLKDNRHTK